MTRWKILAVILAILVLIVGGFLMAFLEDPCLTGGEGWGWC